MLYRRQWVPRTLHATFAFFERPENLPRITPPDLAFQILTPSPVPMAQGVSIDYRVRVLGIRTRWRSLIAEYAPPDSFRDVQTIGPYRRWDHRHRFFASAGGTIIEDLVVYALPWGALGRVVHRVLVRSRLEAIFDFREAQIARLLGTDAAVREAR
jgi:ligand-binding SRPBCC domain-containing protein